VRLLVKFARLPYYLLYIKMANEVDLNNNSNNESASMNGVDVSKVNNESDDLILKLKRIILEQEKEDYMSKSIESTDGINKLKTTTTNKLTSKSFIVTEVKETPKLVKNLMNTPLVNTSTLVNSSTSTLNSTISSSNSTLSKSSSTTFTKSTLSNSRSPSKSPSRTPLNRSPLSERKSQICKINKSPTPSRKMINQSKNESNGRSATPEPLIKETIKKINDKAVDKVNEMMNGSTDKMNSSIDKMNGSIDKGNDSIDKANNNTKVSNEIGKSDLNENNESSKINGLDSKKNDKLNDKVKEDLSIDTKTVKNTKKTNDNQLNRNESTDKESIKIIQSKSIYGQKLDSAKSKPIDVNNNENAKQQIKLTNDEVDRQIMENSQVNALPAKVVPEKLTEIELIIRASNIDGKRKGADLFCQEYFMDLYLLAELNYIHLKISTVDLKKPPLSFRNKFSQTKPPILLVKHGDEQLAILENEKIERYIMKNIKGGHLLFIKDPQTAKLIENLYSKFKLALSRNEAQTKQSLLKQLEAIDKHLAERNTKFITGDHICCFDFELITKLQHIRIAGTYFIDQFEIPTNLVHLWRYMNTMYHLNAFIESTPDDQTIISHYLDTNMNLLNRASPEKNKQTHLELQKPIVSISTP